MGADGEYSGKRQPASQPPPSQPEEPRAAWCVAFLFPHYSRTTQEKKKNQKQNPRATLFSRLVAYPAAGPREREKTSHARLKVCRHLSLSLSLSVSLARATGETQSNDVLYGVRLGG